MSSSFIAYIRQQSRLVLTCSLVFFWSIWSTTPLAAQCGFSVEGVLYTNATCGQSDGAAELILAGGTQPFTYTWSTGANTASVTSLAAGIYGVTVEDATGCRTSETVYIQNDAAPVLSGLVTTDATCQATDGAIEFTATGVGPYVVDWSGAATGTLNSTVNTIRISNLGVGAYEVGITDANGCRRFLEAEVSSSTFITANIAVSQAASCGGGVDGEITAQATSGTLPFEFFLDGVSQGPASNQTSFTYTNLASGVYVVRIVDGNGCDIVDTVIVNEGATTPALNAADFTFTQVSCPSGTDGSVTAASCATCEVYNLNTGALVGTLATPITTLEAGQYEIRLDNAGCISRLPFQLTAPSTWTFSVDVANTNCIAGEASIDIEVGGGNGAPYTYAWSNGATTQDLTAVYPGYYDVTITDAGSCTFVYDSIRVNPCTSSDTVYVRTNETITACVDTTDISGNVATIFNVCPGNITGGSLGPINLTGCINYTAGAMAGVDQACIEVCDGQGFCDTTTVVFVTLPSVDTVRQTVLTSTTYTACADTSELAGILSSVTDLNCTSLDNGSITNINTNTACIDYAAGTVMGLDTVCIVLCDNAGIASCDTSIFIFEVVDAIDTTTTALGASTTETACVDLSSFGSAPVSATNLNCSVNTFGTVQSIDAATGCITYAAGNTAGMDSVCVVFCDAVGNCDTSVVLFNVFPVSDTSVINLAAGSPAIDTCLFGNQLPGTITSVTNLNCDANAVGVTIVDAAGCVNYTPASPVPNTIQSDTVCITFCDASYCDTSIFIFNTLPPSCGNVNPDSITTQVSDCTANTSLCFPVPASQIADYTVEVDNGSGRQPYTGTFQACDFVTEVRYSFVGVPTCTNDFSITWTVNGQTLGPVQVTGFAGVVNQLGIWDPSTSWNLSGNVAEGITRNAGATYGTLSIECVGAGTSPTLIGPSIQQQQAQGTALQFAGEGVYQVYFINNLNCEDTTTVSIFCTPSSTVNDTILLGSIGNTCASIALNIDTADIPNIDTIYNACPSSSGSIVNFVITDQQNACVEYAGVSLGTEQACIVVCSDQGICDTTYLNVTVSLERPLLQDDTTRVVFGQSSTTVDVCANDNFSNFSYTFDILTTPVGGTVQGTDCNLTYTLTDPNFCGVDSFEYTVENVGGKDTAKVRVNVPCAPFAINNGFSPNGDGINDVFIIDGINDFPGNEVYIYNRWSIQVHYAQDYKNDWTGQFQGKDLPDGTYFYVLKLNNERGEVYTGYIELHR